jgi:hypothetical protein
MTILGDVDLKTGKPTRLDPRDPAQIRAARLIYGDGAAGGQCEQTAHAILSGLYSGKERAAGLRGDKPTAARAAAEHKAFAKAAVDLNISEPTLRAFAGSLQDRIGALEYRTSMTRSTDPRYAARNRALEEAAEIGRAEAPERAREAIRIKYGDEAPEVLRRAKAATQALETRVPGLRQVLEDTEAGNDPDIISHLADIATGAGLGK